MRELNRIILLIVTMTLISLIVVGIATFLLYRTALDEEKTRLVETAQSQARLIEAIARHEQQEEHERNPMETTLTQIVDAHENYKGFGETGEFTLARRIGDEIVFLLSHRHSDLEFPKPVPIESELAEPMRLALSDLSGTVVGLDYRGVKVLAAYEPVGILNLGIVAKIDLVEIQSPFIRAGLITLGFAFLAISLGALLFFRITNPMIRKLTESEERLSGFMESATDGFVLMDSELNYIDINKSALEMTGKDRKTFIGKNVLDVVPDIKKSGRYDEYKKVIKTGKPLLSSDITPHPKFGMKHTELKAFKVGGGLGMIFTDITERKQAEEVLKRTSTEWKATFDSVEDSILLLDLEYSIIRANLSTSRFLRLDIKEIIGKKCNQLFHEMEAPPEICPLRKMKQTKKTEESEMYLSEKGVWISSSVSPVLDDKGNLIGAVCIIKEITERKQAEEALKESEESLAMAQEAANIGSWDLNLEKDTLFWSDTTYRQFGLEPNEITPSYKDFEKFVHPDDLEMVNEAVKLALDGKKPYSIDSRVISKDGREWIMHTEGEVYRDKKGKPMRFVGTQQDITERKKAEEEIYSLTQFQQGILDNMDIWLNVLDDKGNIVLWNKAAEKISGYSKEDVLGHSKIWEWSYPEEKYRKEIFSKFKKIVTEGEVVEDFDTQIRCKNGENKVISWNSRNLLDKKENPMGSIALGQDITERMKAEEEKERLQAQLIQSEKMAGIGTLTSGIAHEFNNMLQIMSGHAEFAQRTKKPEDMEEALEIVGNTSDRVSKIIKDLLSFSRREPLERKPCDMTELAEFVLSMTEEQLNKNNIKVVREYGGVPEIEVNTSEIQQVLLNMVTNARDAMLPKGGNLEIGIKKVKDNVEISFTDTGTGILEANLGRVFEPFYTTKGAVGGDTRIQGIGLGLSVSYGIVERHGGTIEVESEAGKETTFTIRLPAKVEKDKERVVKEKSMLKAKMTKPRSVLVVDDEEEICKMFTKWLSTEGHNVKSSTTGKKALDLVKKESFDIVFLDIVMPGILAIDTLAEIKEISPKTKVFMITGKLVDKELWKELKAKGASGYLQKPFKIENIKNYIT